MESGWTESQVKILIEMVTLGNTAREIGDKIGKTRNAVIGKINRLKLPFRPKKDPTKKKASLPIKASMPPLTSGCQWDCDWEWCGKPTRPGSAYCQAHYEVSILSPQPKLDVDALVKLAQRR